MAKMFPIVTVDWLQAHLSDPQLVVIDCRFALMEPTVGQQQYQTSHIPGAHYLDLNRDLAAPVTQHGGRHPLPDVEQLAAKLTAIGIHSDPPTLVIAYDDSRFAFAARLWWLLRYLGHDCVAILDGGFQAWQTAGYAVTAKMPTPRSGCFVPQPQWQQVVDIDTVKIKKDLPGVVLVDSREGDRYRGEREPIDPIAGHIPGAVNYPWQEVTNEQGKVKPITDQQSRWVSVQDAEEVLVYCGSGVTACVNLLSLELAGIETGKLYAGSWSDWCSYLGEGGS
ncbi:MAG: sulfurtransferase [Scytolyngbya sp. HA4215-MV1]|jgi:thiosulfate/3-mercaptopyruvate sulfurtransferase|nr:sulfurtransferase [Scytolyngbya sp. HA4215-MV1]